MRNRRGTLIIVFIAMLILAAVGGYSIVMFYRQYTEMKKSAESFDALITIVESVETPAASEISELPEDEVTDGSELAKMKYGSLLEENPDFVGWIRIEGTNIDYPVVQSPDCPDYYLTHGFDGEDSCYGVPYIGGSCIIGESNNLIIYGHHMNNGTMFADLCYYESQEFWSEHPVIVFDTLLGFGEYEIVSAFAFDANYDEFRYNSYTDMGAAEFSYFMRNINARRLYNTGVTVKYGDQLITLSTCEYTHENGRFVVVARKR